MKEYDNETNGGETPEPQTPTGRDGTPSARADMKTCPYCGERILSTAKKCRHCGEWMDARPRQDTRQPTRRQPPASGPQTCGQGTKERWTNFFIGLENAALVNIIICVSCCVTLFGDYNCGVFSAWQSAGLIYIWARMKMYFKAHGHPTGTLTALTVLDSVMFALSSFLAFDFFFDSGEDIGEEEASSAIEDFMFMLPCIAFIVYYAYNIYLVGKTFKRSGETRTGNALSFYSIAWMCASVCLLVFPSDENGVADIILLLLIYASDAYLNFTLFRFASSKYEDNGKIQWGSAWLIGLASFVCVIIIAKMF